MSGAGSRIGGKIIVPAGWYVLNSTWNIWKTVTIEGAHAGEQEWTAGSRLTFPTDTDGIVVNSIFTSPGNLTDAAQTRISGLQVYASAQNVSGRGIFANTVLAIKDCIVRGFKSHGVELHGQSGGGATGNVDFWHIERTRILGNGGHGLYVHGNDANCGVAMLMECKNNGGWGVLDNGYYPNTYMNCQMTDNISGSMSCNQASLLIECYSEVGSYFAASIPDCLVLGGAFDTSSCSSLIASAAEVGWNCTTSGIHIWRRNGTEIARIDASNILTGFPEIIAHNAGITEKVDIRAGSQAAIRITTANNGLIDLVRFTNGLGDAGSINTNGLTTAYTSASDYRLKSNIRPMTGALDRIMALRPVSYDWNAGGAGEGFIAHEAQEQFPLAVIGEKDGEAMQSIDQSKMIGALVAAVQELTARIVTLETTRGLA